MKYHILIVDDDEVVRSGLSLNLEKEGYRVSTASHGEEALKKISEERVDLVLTDLLMEPIDGYELMRRLREHQHELPVVVLTGHGSTDSAIRAVHEGAADYLIKPALPQEIAHRIRSVLDAAQMRYNLERQRRRHTEQTRKDRERLLRDERIEAICHFARQISGQLAQTLQPLNETVQRQAAEQKKDFGPHIEQLHHLESLLNELGAEGSGHKRRFALNELLMECLQSEEFLATKLYICAI